MSHGILTHGFSSTVAAVAMLLTLMFYVSLAPTVEGRDLAEHFKGKKVEIIVGSSPGGGYDIKGRLIARFIGKYLPGQPSAILVRNVPGGGGLRGLRAAMKARPDDVATSWEAVLKLGRPITGGASGPGSGGTVGADFVELIGGPVNMVYGYGGSADVAAAFDRGELDMDRCQEEVVPRLYPQWIKKKILVPIFWWGATPSEEWLRLLEAPMPPHLFDAVKVTQEQKKAFDVAFGLMETMTRAFFMPPGVPDDVYQTWRKAFEATVGDPEFIKGAEVATLEVGLATVEDFERVIRAFRELSPAGRNLVKKLLGQ
ncbi:MAG: hypothetical protein HYY45_09605 [Deltaproteobacteria bacterium]|nr:hypothetical protein [Deltaproteobacteria bacterium]